jgi:triphosphoribosyl-dephospho-CoA synthase
MSATSIRDCFLRACWLDVAVRKPGNVSLASAGHRMQAAQFVASAQASAAPLCRRGARVGERIESAMEATWRAVGCNTNLGILLLCAPLACAAEREGACADADALRRAVERVLSGLDVEDARAAYRAIALAQPGGLGEAPEQDVHQVPTLGLREAMALAASRDTIARQYADGFAELFTIGLAALPSGFALRGGVGDARAEAAETAAVQRVYLGYLRAIPDSHIVRKHGEGVAQTVMAAAQQRAGGLALPDEHVIAGWDESLKAQGINPGTSADLTVATLFAAGLLRAAWHGT